MTRSLMAALPLGLLLCLSAAACSRDTGDSPRAGTAQAEETRDVQGPSGDTPTGRLVVLAVDGMT